MSKEIYQVTKIILFSYGHRLLNYEGKCKNLHGHNAKVEITLRAEKLDSRGMVVDFSEVKNVIGCFINDQLDHKMLLCKKDPLVQVLKKYKEPFFLMDENPTAENIAKLIFNFARREKLFVISVKLWETKTSFAVYSEKSK